ncbi:MAG: nitronate monooxygenase [Clostridiales bacterium]|nr:nitronate monooxygenase [Clostridiales bacterium]
MYKTELTLLIKIQYPIIQAPMAGGPTTPDLVAAVSNAGGLGNLGAGYLTAD